MIRILLVLWMMSLVSGVLASSTAPEIWFHLKDVNVAKSSIAAELEALKAFGFGGIHFSCDQADCGELVSFVADECHRRGLTFRLQTRSGFSTGGGAGVAPERAMRELVCFEVGKKPAFDADDDFREIGAVTFPWDPPVDDGGVTSIIVPNPQKISQKWTYDPAFDYVLYEDEREVFRRTAPRGAWQDAVDMTFRLPRRIGVIKYGHCPELRVEVQGLHVGYREIKVRYSNETMSLDDWETKAGWGLRSFQMSTNATPVRSCRTKTLVFGHVNAKRPCRLSAIEATGWECDKMDPRGYVATFGSTIGRLLKAGVKIDGLCVGNWDCGIQNWTERMEEMFRRQNGYVLRPWLPALFGYILKSEAETERFLIDWRTTCSRLIEDNYYGAIASVAHANGMRVRFGTAFGDAIPGDILRYWQFADEPMCEFWCPHDDAKGFVGSHDFKPVLPCVSAAHIYGKKRVTAEAVCSFEKMSETNYREWKKVIDRHLGRGVSHLVLHPSAQHSVTNDEVYLKGLVKYLTFCGRELERGLPVVDILMYLGDEVNHKPLEGTLQFLNRYKYDYCNQDVLLMLLSVKDGKFVLPTGMSYRTLWIPKGTFLLPATKRRLATLASQGGWIVEGDFIPTWMPPLRKYLGIGGRDLHWYQRRYGNKDLFFLANPAGESRFIYFCRGKYVMTIDPMTGRDYICAPAKDPVFAAAIGK